MGDAGSLKVLRITLLNQRFQTKSYTCRRDVESVLIMGETGSLEVLQIAFLFFLLLVTAQPSFLVEWLYIWA